MADFDIFKVAAAHEDEAVTAGLRISVTTAADGALAALTFHADDESQRFKLSDASASGGVLAAKFEADWTSSVLGISTEDLPFSEVRVEVRPDRPEAGWTVEAPHAALIFCGEASAKTGTKTELVNGELEAGVDATVRVCAGLALIAPPGAAGGLSNMAVRLDLPDFRISSGWIPLSVLDPGGLDDFDMPSVLEWFEEIIPDFDIDPDLPEIDWDVDFNVDFDLPLGLRVEKAAFGMRRVDGSTRIALDISGLMFLWDGAELLNYDAFALRLAWINGTYLLEAQFLTAQYPAEDATGGTDPFGFALPFGLLSASADAVFLRVGLFGHTDSEGKARFCFDTRIEVGGLALTSSLSGDKPYYRTDLRLHLRDLRLMTGKLAKEAPLFAEAKGNADIFKAYSSMSPKDALSQQSFATDLLAEEVEEVPNDFGVTFLDGGVQPGARVFLAWRQTDVARIFTALSQELFGTAPAGALPDGAEAVTLGLEIAWFDGSGSARDAQVRLDIRADEVAKTSDTAITLGPAKNCYSPGEFENGLVLPGGPVSTGSLSDVTTGANPIGLSLPGLDLKVRRPEVHSIVLRRDGDGTDSAAWLVSWSKPLDLSKGHALAEASIDFSFAPPSGKRQVQPADGGRLFRAVVGRPDDAGTRRALQLVGWREGEGVSYLRAFDAGQDFAILPVPTDATDTPEDACPPPPAPSVPPIPFEAGRFRDFALSDDADGGFLLGLQVQIGTALLKQFGDSGVTFEIEQICLADPADALIVRTALKVPLAKGAKDALEGALDFRLRLSDLALSVDDGARLALRRTVKTGGLDFLTPEQTSVGEDRKLVATTPYEIFGFELYGLASVGKDEEPDDVELLTLTFEDGTFRLVTPESTQLLLRYADFGDDGLLFMLDRFALGGGGLDLSGEMLPTTLKLPGLQKPFALETARIEITGGRMTELSIAGTGKLPELLNDAPVSIAATLRQDGNGRVRLADLDCELGDGESPIFSRGTKCRFDLTQITIDRDDAGGTKPPAWFFRISGSMQMQPDGVEFAGNLLEDFKSIRLEFTDAPLGDEFFEHIELIATLKKPERFKVLNLFDMEVRSIGFHPRFPGFEQPKAAIIIGGQIEFGDVGDVLAVEVDFHRLYIGLPKDGELLPQIHAKGLRVEIAASGFKIAGRVDNLQTPLIDGFAGEGTVVIPGLPELSAAFSFVKLRATEADDWKRGWFIAIEAARISLQIGTLPLYLRQIGLGFGYRYTSVLIKTFESEDKLGPLIKLMLDEISKHHSLARIDSWAPDPDRGGSSARWSIGLEGMFSMASANSTPTTYRPKAEQKLKSVLLQLLMFLRSDFTFMAAAKLWFPISADDFFEDRLGMRQRPLALGFMAYSAPKSRLLVHAAKGKNPYLGPNEDSPDQKFLAEMLDNSHFEATFLSEPGLIHAELGWPDRLFFRYRIGALEIECRGGVLFRLEKDMLVQGVYFSARGDVSVSAGVSLGIVGARVTADISVAFAMRLMIGISLSRPLDSTIYAAVGIDVSVAFSVHVWFRLNLRFYTIKIDLRFRLEIQIVVALEIGWAGQGDIGFKAQASVRLSAFGRGLKIKVHVSAGSGVDSARRRLEPYLSSFLEPGGIPPIPGLPVPVPVMRSAGAEVDLFEVPAESAPLASLPAFEAADAEEVRDDLDFVFALREGQAVDTDGRKAWVGWIMPNPNGDALYPVGEMGGDDAHYATLTVDVPAKAEVHYPNPEAVGGWDCVKGEGESSLKLTIRHAAGATLEAEVGGDTQTLTLLDLLAACNIPEDPANYRDEDNVPFPQNWTAGNRFALRPVKLETKARITDDRLGDPDDAALSPRRTLDPENRYDKALMAAIEAAEQEDTDPLAPKSMDVEAQEDALTEQALGNQAFLFRAFNDDMAWLAEKLTFDGEKLQKLSLDGRGRPTLADLGMVVIVVAETCPDWLCRFGADAPAKLKMKIGDDDAEKDLRPVVDFHDSNFALNPPDLREVVSKADDETLVFSWTIDWPGAAPEGVLEEVDVEDFLDHYDVQIFEGARVEPLERATLRPCDILAREDKNAPLTRVATRFQYVRKISEFALDRTRLLAGATRFRARIVPVAQDGSRGQPLEPVAVYRASAAPLPADGATLRLHRAEDGLDGTLYWREPLPPNDASVALTERWELILRPVVPVPLGAYPHGTAEADDQPLTGTTRLGLKDGDIVVTLKNLQKPDGVPDIWQGEAEPGEAQELSGAFFALPLPKSWADMQSAHDARLFDHRGAPLSDDRLAAKRAIRFFERSSATEPDGAGWRLLLRPSAVSVDGLPTEGEPGDRLPEDGYGALVRVPMLLAPEPERDAEDEGAARFRALDYFEWPHDADSRQVSSEDLRHDVGPVTMAAIDLLDGGALGLRYQPRPGDARAVTVTWNADGRRAGAGLLDTARFEVFEARLDRLLNADAKVDGFDVAWTRLRSVQVTDRPFAGRAVTSFVEPHVWDTATPVYRETIARLGEADLTPREMARRWPGYYSWRESDLAWPPFAREVRTLLRSANDAATVAPLLQAGDKKAKPTEVAAALHALGAYAAKRDLHPWLAMVAGALVRQGAPAGLGGTADDVAAEGTVSAGRFDLEVAPGKPGPVDPVPNPIAWMQGDVEPQDPTGWGALHHFGLSATFALRNPVTGLYLGQAQVRGQIAEAVAGVEATLAAILGDLDREIADVWDALEAARVAGATEQVDRLESGPGAFRRAREAWAALTLEKLEEHLAVDLPLQTAAAIRSGGDDRVLGDATALSMVQVSLRPVPEQMADGARDVRYGVLNVPEIGSIPKDLDPITFKVRTEAAYLDAGTYATDVFDADAKVPIGDVLRDGGGPLLLRWIGADDMAAVMIEAAKGAGITITRDTVAEDQPIAFRDISETGLPPTPYGVFDVPLDVWQSEFSDAVGKRFRGFLDYIESAFAVGADADAVATSGRAMREMVAEHEKRAEIYTTWSHRFFGTAPLRLLDEPAETAANSGDEATPLEPLFDPRRVTAATPRRTDPALLAPDDLGRMTLTHMIEEDWASLRAYAVCTVPRYWDLLREDEKIVPPVLDTEQGRVDVAIPRRRPVLAPKLLGTRILTDRTTDRHFHEITTAEHVEQALSRSSVALARKLEFQDTLRHFSIAFRETNWLEKLVEAKLSQAADSYRIVETAKGAVGQAPAEGLGESDYLSFLPLARFGANRSVVAAEPFYYAQTVTLAARAVDVASPTNAVPLPRPPAASPEPYAEDGSAVKWGDNSWKALGLEVEIPDGVPEPLTEYLPPQSPAARIRFPRLMELLPPKSLRTHFAAEIDEHSYGRLPDPQSRLEIVRQTPSGRAALATIAAKPDAETAVFEVAELADNFLIQIGGPEGVAPDALHWTAAWTRILRRNGWQWAPLPAEGPLAQLAPVALRLVPDDQGMTVHDPILGPRALFRPSIRPEETRPAGLDDISAGLRLLMHPAHQAALVPEVLAAADVLRSVDFGLVPVLSKPLGVEEITHSFDEDRLWHLEDGGWTEIESGTTVKTAEGSRLLLVVQMKTAAGRPDFDESTYASFLDRVETVEGTPAIGEVAGPLEAIHALAEAWLGAAGPESWQVVAHHGNLDGADWGDPETSGGGR